jgi:phosphoglycolate phosphatase
MPYRLVMFDFDGTLANSFPWVRGIVNEVADRFGFRRIEESEVELLRGYDVKSILAHVNVPVWKLPMIGHHVLQRMGEEIAQIPLFDDTAEMLQRLAAEGTTLGVVSSNAANNIRQVLGPDLAALIEYYECGVSFLGKATKLRSVVQRSGIPPQQAIYIGDETRDIEAAHKARIASGAVIWGYATLPALQRQAPTEIFTCMDEIVTRLTR